jgi:ribosomal 50S subunit-recycling heat shock protein
LASQGVAGGKVKLNGERVKPAHELRIGDRLSLNIQQNAIEIEVVAMALRRGSASVAMACYIEAPQTTEREWCCSGSTSSRMPTDNPTTGAASLDRLECLLRPITQ